MYKKPQAARISLFKASQLKSAIREDKPLYSQLHNQLYAAIQLHIVNILSLINQLTSYISYYQQVYLPYRAGACTHLPIATYTLLHLLVYIVCFCLVYSPLYLFSLVAYGYSYLQYTIHANPYLIEVFYTYVCLVSLATYTQLTMFPLLSIYLYLYIAVCLVWYICLSTLLCLSTSLSFLQPLCSPIVSFSNIRSTLSNRTYTTNLLHRAMQDLI